MGILPTIAFLLAVATLANSQNMGMIGTEPWSFAPQVACQMKKVDLTAASAAANQCVMGLTAGSQNPLAICDKKKQRNDCVKPYYDKMKDCFEGAGKTDVDKAFKAQKEFVNFMCMDNGKRMTSMKPEDLQCQQKPDETCMPNVMKDNMPDPSRLFSDNNCKVMHGMVNCGAKGFDHCKSTTMKDLIVDQMNSVLAKTPCGEANGASTFSVVATPILLFALLCHGVMKALF